MKKPLISVIVPIYNVELYLERCIISIITQTIHDIEIILIDDGSTDKSSVIADRYALKDDRILVVYKLNGYVGMGKSQMLHHIGNISSFRLGLF